MHKNSRTNLGDSSFFIKADLGGKIDVFCKFFNALHVYLSRFVKFYFDPTGARKLGVASNHKFENAKVEKLKNRIFDFSIFRFLDFHILKWMLTRVRGVGPRINKLDKSIAE